VRVDALGEVEFVGQGGRRVAEDIGEMKFQSLLTRLVTGQLKRVE
jgi:hypothetical protein